MSKQKTHLQLLKQFAKTLPISMFPKEGCKNYVYNLPKHIVEALNKK